MTPEGKVKKRVVDILKRHDVYYFFPFSAGYARAGIPDIICCVSGWFVGIECKTRGKTPTALQDRELRRIQTAKGVGLWVDEDHLEVLEKTIISLKGETPNGKE